MRARGETRVGLVFVAGEERGSEGAMAANRIASRSRYLINGEPTDNRLGAATRGVFRVRLTTKRAWPPTPATRRSAVGHREPHRHPGLAARRALARACGARPDALHGRTDRGWRGPERRAGPRRRRGPVSKVGPHDERPLRARRRGRGRADVEEVLEVPPVQSRHPRRLRDPRCSPIRPTSRCCRTGAHRSCSGPGSIHVAHTDEEHVRVEELLAGVDLYDRLATALLAEVGT